MKKKLITAAIITLAVAGLFTIGNISAISTTPGGADDPVASKSYVDTKFNELLGLLSGNTSITGGYVSDASMKDKLLAEVMDQIETFYAGKLNDSSGRYMPVSAEAGQTIIGGEGTEIILRSGSALGYITGANGIVNATDGTEIYNNTTIKANNILIVPRDDGRGVTAITDCWFMVKGDYKFLK